MCKNVCINRRLLSWLRYRSCVTIFCWYCIHFQWKLRFVLQFSLCLRTLPCNLWYLVIWWLKRSFPFLLCNHVIIFGYVALCSARNKSVDHSCFSADCLERSWRIKVLKSTLFHIQTYQKRFWHENQTIDTWILLSYSSQIPTIQNHQRQSDYTVRSRENAQHCQRFARSHHRHPLPFQVRLSRLHFLITG